jgi:hypothetical protein
VSSRGEAAEFPQHLLNFTPELQGHGELRCVFATLDMGAADGLQNELTPSRRICSQSWLSARVIRV